MATIPETQALLGEIKTPTICTRGSVRTNMKPFQAKVNEMSQQLSRLRMLLGLSELTEVSTNILSKYEHYDDQLRTADRLLTEIHKKIRETYTHFVQMAQSEKELMDIARDEGYTT